ncbi:unnamed protein product, partial [Rotaria sp. Silwood1]
MTTYYTEHGSSGSQYYFNPNCSTTSQSYPNYSSSLTTARTYGTSDYSTYPVGISSVHSPRQQIRLDRIIYNHDDPYQLPVNKIQATIRLVNSQDQYHSQRSTKPIQISPQHQHFQFDSRHQPDRSMNPVIVYQTPGATKYTHRNADTWTANPSQGHDHRIKALRVSVRSVPTAAPQQSSSSAHYHQGQHRSQASIVGEQHCRQVSPTQRQRGRSEAERQRQDEEDYYAAQRIMAAQRMQQQQQEHFENPAGIRNLMSTFSGTAPVQIYEQRSKTILPKHHSSDASNSGSCPTTITRIPPMLSITYSALPKHLEPPVNTIEFYQMQKQQQPKNQFINVQQVVAPSHIQHAPARFSTLNDRFQTGSYSENMYQTTNIHENHKQQQQQTRTAENTMSSFRNQYTNKTQESEQYEISTQEVRNISRTILGEDLPQQKKTQISQQQQAQTLQSTQQEQSQVPETKKPQSQLAQPTQQQSPATQATKQKQPTDKQHLQAPPSTEKQQPQPPQSTAKQQPEAPQPTAKQLPEALKPTEKQQPEALQPTEKAQQPQPRQPTEEAQQPQAPQPTEKQQPQASQPTEKQQQPQEAQATQQ